MSISENPENGIQRCAKLVARRRQEGSLASTAFKAPWRSARTLPGLFLILELFCEARARTSLDAVSWLIIMPDCPACDRSSSPSRAACRQEVLLEGRRPKGSFDGCREAGFAPSSDFTSRAVCAERAGDVSAGLLATRSECSLRNIAFSSVRSSFSCFGDVRIGDIANREAKQRFACAGILQSPRVKKQMPGRPALQQMSEFVIRDLGEAASGGFQQRKELRHVPIPAS